METRSKKTGFWTKNFGVLGIGLCALCCAMPFIGIIGGTGVLAVISLYAEKVALVLLIISAGLLAFRQYKKRQTPPTCSVDCSCKNVDSASNSIKSQ